MPLVSGGHRGSGGMPSGFRARSSPDFWGGNGGSLRGTRRGIQNRRAREIKQNDADVWKSVPEGIQEEEEGGFAASDSGALEHTIEDIHDRRRRMMDRMRSCRTQQQLAYSSSPDVFRKRSPEQIKSEVVESGLLERRRVLMKALKTIKSESTSPNDPDARRDWNSLPGSFDRRGQSQQQQPQQDRPPMSAEEKRRRFVRWHSSALGLGGHHQQQQDQDPSSPMSAPPSEAGGAPTPSSRPCTPGGTRRMLPRIPSVQEIELRRQLQQGQVPGRPAPFRRQTSMVASLTGGGRSTSSVRSDLLETIQSGSLESGDSI